MLPSLFSQWRTPSQFFKPIHHDEELVRLCLEGPAWILDHEKAFAIGCDVEDSTVPRFLEEHLRRADAENRAGLDIDRHHLGTVPIEDLAAAPGPSRLRAAL